MDTRKFQDLRKSSDARPPAALQSERPQRGAGKSKPKYAEDEDEVRVQRH